MSLPRHIQRPLLLLGVCMVLLQPVIAAPIIVPQAPVLKWQRGGCTSWCETGWYSSPAVADLDGDGHPEVIAALYSVFVLDGVTGSTKWRVDPPGDRVWPGVAVTDVDADGVLDIITAHGGGYIHVWRPNGEIRWTRRPSTSELRSLAVADLDGDRRAEIVVSAAIGSRTNTWVYDANGTLRIGWPQLSNDTGYAAGIYNANVAVGDLNGDGYGEVIAPSDVHYICAYRRDGVQMPANMLYGSKAWGKVGVWESIAIEVRGWGACDGTRAESYRTNFAHGAAVIADVNGDGAAEVVVTGNVYDCSIGHPPGKYNGVYIFNADRSRFQLGIYDWRMPPIDTGAPLSEDYTVIENNQPNPAVADLDGDGRQEIVYASYDGRVHVFWLDKTEHGAWPYSVYDSGEGVYRFASEPAIADLDGDGLAEVIFASWPRKTSGLTGRLHILDYLGRPIHELSLPIAPGTWNGGLAAPTLADIDGDPDLEVVLVTAHSGVVAYDMPGTGSARVLWATGRGNLRRSALVPGGSLASSRYWIAPVRPAPGDVLTYTLSLNNSGSTLLAASATVTIAPQIQYLGDLWASSGTYGIAGDVITWTGSIITALPVTLTYRGMVLPGPEIPYPITSQALLTDGLGASQTLRATAIVGGLAVHLPLVLRH